MTKHPSFGTILSWDPAGGTSYTALGQVMDIGGPNITRGDIDVTDHDNAASIKYRTFLPGVPDAGDISFQLNFDPNNANHVQGVGTGILGDFEQSGCTLATWELALNVCGGTAIWTFAGYMNSASPTYAVEGQLLADAGVKISGKPTLTVT